MRLARQGLELKPLSPQVVITAGVGLKCEYEHVNMNMCHARVHGFSLV